MVGASGDGGQLLGDWAAGRTDRRGQLAVSRQRLVTGRRRSRPKPFTEIFVPGGY